MKRALEHDETLAAGVATSTAPTPPPGETIAGRYRILGLLGVGGMGAVYKVRDLELDEIVALKTLKHGWIDQPDALERFRREVKLARKVTHPNVARTFDIGEHRPSAGPSERFLTMELVDGPSLARRLEERGALPIADAIELARAIAAALEAAHDAGVIHRDLKPDNVLLDRSGRVVVTDFGIARSHVASEGGTAAGSAIGTPAYMAPEQVEGEALDGRADLYALGLVLYEMLAGAPAFSGATPFAVAAARLVKPPPDPARARADVPAPLAALVLKLLARRPSDRPASAREVRAALEALTTAARSAPPSAPPPPIVPEVARSLAVVPLRMEGAADDAWIAEGATADLVDALCTVRGLRVRARVAPEPGEDARTFGRRMGVELVVEGAVRRIGDAVRVTTRLTSVVDGFQIWASRTEGTLGELVMITDRAAREISAAIAGAEPTAAARAADAADAAEAHVRARTFVSAILDDTSALDRLIALRASAPEEPRLLASLAIALARVGGFFGDERQKDARATAERAIEIAPALGEPWVALAHVRFNGNDTPGAMRALRRALRNGPSVADAHDLAGRLLHETDRQDEAMRFLDRALWLDPTLAFARVDRARIHAFRGDWERAERELEAIAELHPTHHASAATRLRLWAGRDPGTFPDTRSPLGDMLALVRQVALTRTLRPVDEEAVARWLTGAVRSTRGTRLFHQIATEIYLVAGRRERAVAALATAVDAGLEDLGWLRHCPLLAPLRGSPELEAAERTVGERAELTLRAWAEG